MIRILGDSSPAPLPDYDLCVIGSGPAGMALAREIHDAGISVCVLESGALRPTAAGDRLKRVRSEGILIKDYSRERVFGGASTTWAGLSSPLDPGDLAPRPWLRSSGWPIAEDELARFYEAAGRYRFPALAEFGGGGFGALRAKGDLSFSWGSLEEKIFLAAAEPQNFGKEHRAIFDEAGIDLWLDATVTRLEANKSSGRIDRAVVRAPAGNELRLHAKVFVVAAGGIENARLLLNSRDLEPRGLGNERDQVGRWFMNHPKNYHGIIRLARPVVELPYYLGCLHGGFAGYAGLKLREPIQRERRLLNSYVRFEPLYPWSGGKGVESLVTIVKRSRFLLKSFKARRKGKLVSLRDYSETGDDSDLQNERKTAAGWLGLGANVALDLPRVARYAYFRFAERARPRIEAIRLRNFMEMEPDPENRVTLGEERDELGERLPVVRHRVSELDRRSMVAVHEALAEEVPRSGLGRLETQLSKAEPWPIDQDASHHMGTTRMGTDPAVSVVDPTLRVHAIPNLYLAGASVFPTSGCANPTFTIVALSIRLAQHLRERVFAARPEGARA